MIFSKKEKEVKKLFLDHFEKVGESLSHLKDLIVYYLKNDKEFKNSSFRVHQSEHEADLVKRNIEKKLYEGAFMPINRSDYIILAEFVDRIANQAEITANLIVLTRPQIPDFIRDDLVNLMDKSRSAFKSLHDALELIQQDFSQVKEAAKQVIVYEEEADRIEWETVKKIFKSDLELALKLQLRELVHDIAQISDYAEDTAERFYIMLVKQAL